MERINLTLSPEVFPVVFKDIDLGVYFLESKFPDASTDRGKVQIMLDNNVMGMATADPWLFVQKIGWYFGLHAEASLNPALAIVVQCLSNTQTNALKHIEEFEKAFQPLGMFPEGYAKMMVQDVIKRDNDLRQQVGFLFCYVALLRYYYKAANNAVDTLHHWTNLFAQDIPRLTFMCWLGGIFILSKTNKKLKLVRQEWPVEKFADGFFDFRSQEKDDYTRWLRNRVFDLLQFLLAPTLSFERLGGFSSRTLVASKDKFIGEFLGRLFAWHGEQQQASRWQLIFLSRMIEVKDEVVADKMQQLRQNMPIARPHPTEEEKKAKLRNLIDITLTTLNPDEAQAVHTALYEFRIFESLVESSQSKTG